MQIVYAIEQEFNLRLPFGAENLSLSQRGIARIAILDDQYLGAPASVLAGCWEDFENRLGDSGHTVQVAKTRAFAPAWAHVQDTSALPMALQTLFSLLPRSVAGIPMLGSAAISGGNPIDTVLLVQPDEISLAAPTKRCERALELAEAVTAFALSLTLTPQEGEVGDRAAQARRPPQPQQLTAAAHMGWMLLSKVVASALSYDAGLVQPSSDPWRTVSGMVCTRLWNASLGGAIVGP